MRRIVSAGAVAVFVLVIVGVAVFLYVTPSPDAPIIDSAPPPMPEWLSANRVSVAGVPHYTRHDGELKPITEMDIETGDWSYLKAETKDAVTLQIDKEILTIPKANTVFNYTENKISLLVTYTKADLKAVETVINASHAYITFPYTMSAKPISATGTSLHFNGMRFDAGNDHITVKAGKNMLSKTKYDFKIVGGEIRLYYDMTELGKMPGIITFETHSWSVNNGIISGLTGVGTYSDPTVFQMDSTWYLISGERVGGGTAGWESWNWTGSVWQGDSAIISGLAGKADETIPEVFQMGDTWHFIAGGYDGCFSGYHWTGSTWASNTTIISGLGDVGFRSSPMVFQMDSTWYLIAGENDGVFNGYHWTGSTWASNTTIISGLGDVGLVSHPEVFQMDSTWYLISGESDGVFNGYNWAGSAWQSDSAIISGLGDVGYHSTPTVFQMDSTWYLISGEETAGGWNGWNLPVSATYIPPDPTNLQHTTSVGWVNYTWSAGAGNVTDSYNVLHNDVWSNGSANAYLNSEVGAGNWSNITVYAWNSSGAGTLSAGSVSDQNTAQSPPPPVIPPPPINIGNTTGNFWVNHTWSAGAGNVTDSYRVLQNGTWYNSTMHPYYNATSVGAHGHSDLTVYAYNSTGSGTLSVGNITQNTTLSNNQITITNTSGWNGNAGENVYVDYDATDDDSDTPTFSCNRTDLFSDFNPATGVGNWIFAGTVYVDFGVSDGHGSMSNYTMAILAGINSKPPSPTTLANTTGNFWVNHTWSAGAGNITDSYRVYVNGGWHNSTLVPYYNDTYSAHAWQNITVYAWNSSGTGMLSD